MQQYAIVFFPKIPQEAIQQLREKYDPDFLIIPPHMTLLYPIQTTTEKQLIQKVKMVIDQFHAFPILLAGIAKTHDNCLFLLIKENEHIIKDIHKKFSSYITPNIPDMQSFTPHITLGCFQKNTQNFYVSSAYNEARQLSITLPCLFDSVTIIKGDGKHAAEKVATITLQ